MNLFINCINDNAILVWRFTYLFYNNHLIQNVIFGLVRLIVYKVFTCAHTPNNSICLIWFFSRIFVCSCHLCHFPSVFTTCIFHCSTRMRATLVIARQKIFVRWTTHQKKSFVKMILFQFYMIHFHCSIRHESVWGNIACHHAIHAKL